MFVYVDLLFLENSIINYLILYIGAKMTGLGYNKYLMLLASAVGGLYAVLSAIFFYVPLWFSLPGKLCISLAMIIIAYLPESIGQFLRSASCFYVCTFVLAGSVLAMDEKFRIVGPAILIAVMLVLVTVRYKHLSGDRGNLVMLELVDHNGASINVTALADTGCSLADPISGNPAIILESEDLLSTDDQIRLIPYSTATDSGILKGIRFRKAIVHNRESSKEIPAPIVCPVDRKLGGGKYKAIISAEALR